MSDWVKIACAILSGIATCIPLAVKLIEYVRKAVKEKNWNQLIDLVLRLMKEAESKFDTGADRKEWVLVMVKASADTIQYDINLDEVGALIDSLCDMSKAVNCEQNTR